MKKENEIRNNIYLMFDKFIENCIINNNSILSDNKEVVTIQNLNEINNILNLKAIIGNEQFIIKAKRQFADEPDPIKEAFANILWLWGLCSYPGSVKVSSKEKEVKIFFANSLPVFLEGFISTGIYHTRNKPDEITYIANILIKLKNIEGKDDILVLKEKAVEIIKNYQNEKKVVMKNLLLHLFNPDIFENIISYKQKNQIYKHWNELTNKKDIDDGLLEIRNKLKSKFGENFEFYDKEIKELWDTGINKTKDMEKEDLENQNLNDVKKESMKVDKVAKNFIDSTPLNLILYGPPGTGKTYELRNKYITRFTDQHVTQSREDYLKELVSQLAWWEVISVVMLDLKTAKVNQIFEHPILQAKNAGSINKTPRNTIWAWLQRHTKMECPNVNSAIRNEPLFFWKNEKSEWSIDSEVAKNETPELLEVLDKYKNYKPKNVEEKRYVFTTFHQSYSYEDFVEGIKPIMSGDEEEIEGQLKYKITPGIFKIIVNNARVNPDKEYAIFIDEINRGNIANIFGELITLIETDKRLGNEQELVATLPYSKEKFGVPSNLYIIGTMNTADRSVEALDTALRRRFCFVEMPPLYDLQEMNKKVDGINLSNMLEKINDRIEKLLSKDQLIGHSYFMKIDKLGDLKSVFQNNILPLLQEYFYGDIGKIGLVLGQGFFESIDSKDNLQVEIFANFTDSEKYSELFEKQVYHLKNLSKMSDTEFKEAMNLLLK